MARAIWTGAISFGLVNVPVKAYTAVRDHEVHFHQLERSTGARIRYKKVSETSGKELSGDDIHLGYELDRGTYVTVDPDELAALRPSTTRSIDVGNFVDLSEVDPIYYQNTYWLAPDGEAAQRPYNLLRTAMSDAQRVGIGTVVMRNKQYLAAIRPLDGALAMSTMRFADEVVPQSAIDQLPGRSSSSKADPRELRLAAQIIDSLATEWNPKRYRDTYTEELKDLIERKAKGDEIVVDETPAARTNVVDLMAALEASVGAAKKARRGNLAKEVARAADRLAKEAGDADSAQEADDAEESRSDRQSRRPSSEGAKRSPAKAGGKKASAKGSPASKTTTKKSSGRKSA